VPTNLNLPRSGVQEFITQFTAIAAMFCLTLSTAIRLRRRCGGTPLPRLSRVRQLLLLKLLCFVSVTTARVDVNLATWTKPAQGLEVRGALTNDNAGGSVADAGDVNNDGYRDILIGASYADVPGRADAGAAYLIFGSPSHSITTVDTASALVPTGIKILGAAVNDFWGYSVSGAGDVNCDGIDDLIVGGNNFTPSLRGFAGAAVVIFGKTSGWADIDLASFTSGSAGFWIWGAAAGDACGFGVSAVGDVNGDGVADIVVGALSADPLGRIDAGISYVIFGQCTASAYSTLDLSMIGTGTGGFKICGANAHDQVGEVVSGAGDLNNDGYGDVLVSSLGYDCPGATNDCGAAYVIFGHSNATAFTDIDLAALSSGQGFRITGAAIYDYLGSALSGAGDFNDDGYDDIVVASQTNKVYVLFGHSSATTFSDIDMTTFGAGVAGFMVSGGGYLGNKVSGGCDVNGDGVSDIVLTAPADSSVGITYVLYGRSQPHFVNINVQTGLSISAGFRILGYATSSSGGWSVSLVRDFDGDGAADILVGMRLGDPPSGVDAGISFLVYGELPAPTSQPSRQPTSQPSRQPTSQPSRQPSRQPTSQPSRQPTSLPSRQPTGRPSHRPLTERTGDVNLATWSKPGQGLEVWGGASGVHAGCRTAGAGDVNRDGYQDILVGAEGVDESGKVDVGAVYLVFGTAARSVSVIDTATAAPPKFVKISGWGAYDYWGNGLAPAGDFNKDGIDDFITGGSLFDSPLQFNTGGAVVIFGKTSGWTDIDLTSFTSGSEGFWIWGAVAFDQVGAVLSGAGDVNGDGADDLVIGAYDASAQNRLSAGVAYVIFGHSAATPFDTIDLFTFSSGSAGIKILGATSDDQTAISVGDAGDINHDGFGDIIIGAHGYDGPAGTNCGAAYVIFGHSTATAFTDIDLAALSSSQGFRVTGGVANGGFGYSVSSAGDFNRDGYDDVVIGSRANMAFVLFGHSNSTAFPPVDLAAFTNGIIGFEVTGTGDLGYSVSGGTDVNGDGADDIAIAAPVFMSTGAVYVFYGRSQVQLTAINADTGLPSVSGFRIIGATALMSGEWRVGFVGDFDGDGIGDVLVGARYAAPVGRTEAGTAYLIYGELSAPTSQPSTQPTEQPSCQPTSQPSRQPTRSPSGQPTAGPSGQPATHPSSQPSMQPTGVPTLQPSKQPSSQPSRKPSAQPTSQPSRLPTGRPTAQPFSEPSSQPSAQPIAFPSGQPSRQPTIQPISQPSTRPTSQPTKQPSGGPSAQPSRQPTAAPIARPSSQPSGQPSGQPVAGPSGQPSRQPSTLPSTQPSQQPSGQPSHCPTMQPSLQPTAVPSRQPTEQPVSAPTALPSSRPSAQPSRQPTSQPSCVPSRQPSTQPTQRPSAGPTTQPSAQPTLQLSDNPSSQPSVQPSTQPTCQPAGSPSSLPSRQPSAGPSAQPTQDPTAQPSVGPSGQPSSSPTGQPTSCPSVQPSQLPTQQPNTGPSAQPSTQPSSEPSSCPTLQPTSHPNAKPSRVPTAQPSRRPTALPSAQPDSHPSFAPSNQPTSMPSAQPSRRPSPQPSYSPSSQPSVQPSMHPSHQPTSQPSCAPSNQPSVVPTTQPTIQPTAQPSGQPTHGPSSQPTSAPTLVVVAPATLGCSVNVAYVERTYATVQVALHGARGGNVRLYAVIKIAGSSQSADATTALLQQGSDFAANIAQQKPAKVNVTSLLPSTDYNIYCAATSSQGVTMSLSSVLATSQSLRTTCCRAVTVAVLHPATVNVGLGVTRAVSIALEAPPTAYVVVTVQYTPRDQTSAGVQMLPSVLRFDNRSTTGSGKDIRLTALGVGNYTLLVSVTGASATEYGVVYAGARRLTVLPAGATPTVPKLLQAAFSNDGSYVTLGFDSATDRGNQYGPVSCRTLLRFVGDNSAQCQWFSDSQLRIYPTVDGSGAVLDVDGNVTLIMNTIKAKCADAGRVVGLCVSYGYATSTTVVVTAPSAPTAPSVVISAPLAISGCNPLPLDVTGSVGAAGRPWEAVTFAVSASPASTAAEDRLQQFMSRNYTLSPPLPVPSTVLAKGFTYTIKVTLCNFLKACGSATKVVSVAESVVPVPVVTIAGQPVRTVYCTDPLTVVADAYTQSCSGTKSSAGLLYTWSVTQLLPGATAYVNSTLRSSSQNPTVFKLPAYTLSVGGTYTIVVTALSTASGRRSSTTVKLKVAQSDIVAVLNGGSTRYAMVGERVTLDASGSYEKDYPQQALSKSAVSYTWHCLTVAPVLSAAYVVTLHEANPGRSSIVNVTTTYAALNTTTVVSVTVSDTSRSSTAQVRIIILQAPSPRLSVTAVGSTENINTGKPFTLLGALYLLAPCTAAWGVDDPTIALSTAARTPVQQFMLPAAGSIAVPFNLVVKSDALPQRSTLQFTLSCGSTGVSTTVTTNGAPQPGTFSVKPGFGVELSTSFTFAATQWSDPDLPLTYQFGFGSTVSLSKLVIVSRSELSYTTSSLPAGDASRSNAVDCSLRIFNNLGAFADKTVAVLVTTLDAVDQSSKMVLELLKSNADSVQGVKTALAVGSSVINAVNCTAAPNCAALNRYSCRRTSGLCGGCLQGFAGDGGDRNTLCVSLTAPPSQLAATKGCAYNCSGHGQCTFVDRVTGDTIAKCTLENTDCDATCVCIDNYSGEFCEIDPVTLRRRREVRSNLILSLSNLTAQEDINTESVAAWSANLYALSIRPHEVSQVDAAVLADIANTTLHHAIALGVDSYADMLGVLQATDAVASLQRYNYNPNDYRDADFNTSRSYVNNTAARFIPVVSTFADMVRNAMVLGENQTTLVYDNFRVTVALAAGSRVEESRSVPAGEQQDVTAASSVALQTVTDAVVPAVAIKVMSTSPRSYATDTTDYVSSPVRLQVQALGSERSNAAEYLSSIEFTFQHNALQTLYTHYVQDNFTSTCKALNASQIFTYHCPGSQYMIRHNCSRGAGVHVSYCPKPAAACAMIALETAEITTPSACTVLNSTTTHTTCRCTVSAGSGAEMRRSLTTTEQQILDATGATDMLATTVYIASDFADTFNSAGALNNATLSSVLVVVLLLGSVWVAGLSILAVEWGVHWWNPVKEKNIKEADGVRSILTYIDSVIPKVFERGTSSVRRLVTEVAQHHVLFEIAAADTPAERWFLMVQALTELTLLFFLTAAFFDVSQPGDDGTCPRYSVEDECLMRVCPFDYSQTYCTWVESGINGSEGQCSFNNQDMSTKALFYMTVLTTVISSIVSIPIDYQFATLKAPTALSLEGSKVSAVVDTVVSGARRVSNAGLAFFEPARVAPTPSSSPSSKSDTNKGRIFLFTQATEGVVANREIPASIAQVSIAARGSLGIIGRNASTLSLGAEGASKALRSRSTRIARRSTTATQSSSLTKLEGAGVRMAEPTALSMIGANDDAGVELLIQDVVHQRLLMNSSAKETKLYDAQWGVLSDGAGYAVHPKAADCIETAVRESNREASRLDQALCNYSLQHAGIEMLYLFMLDLLGRNTIAAKIFKEKFGEEFGHSRVVVGWQKVLAAAALLALNAFFIYFVMIKGVQKGRDWQVQYVACCLVQIGVDILLFETVECAWLNFLVPQYVHEEVASAAEKLRSLTQRIAGLRTDIEEARPEQEVTKFFLNAPPHLFVSTKLAKKKPQLLESMIVSSYRHHLPGEICKTWPHYSVGEEAQRPTQVRSWLSLLRWVLRGLTLSLQLFVGVPFAYQKVALRFAQPIVFSGLALIIYTIFTSVVGLVAIGSCVFAAVLYAVRRWWYAGQHPTGAVNPAVDGAEEPTFISEASSSEGSADLSSEDSESEEEEGSEEIEFWEVGYDDESDSAATSSDGASPGVRNAEPTDDSDDAELSGGERDDDRTASGELEGSVHRGSGDTEGHSVTRSSGSESAELHSELQVTGINSDTEGAPSSEPVSWDEGSDAEHTGSDHESHGSQDTLQSLQLLPEGSGTEEEVGSWDQGNSSEEEQAHRDDGSDRSMQELHSPLREPWSSGTEDASGSWDESGSGGELRYGDDGSGGSYGDGE
jgi:hypothetical protein